MKRGQITALAIAVIAVGWIMSGQFPEQSDTTTQTVTQASESSVPSVRVQGSVAQPKIQEISLFGRTEADRSIDIRAETDGQVIELKVREGQLITTGDVVVRLAIDGRDARVRDAESQLNYRKIAYNAAEKLSKDKFLSEVKLAEEQAELSAAYAELAIARVELARTRIMAPFEGVVGELYVEEGKSVQSGDTIIRIDDLNPIVVVAQITEREVMRAERGQRARVTLASGKQYTGVIGYISRTADALTRTFQVEVAIDNADLGISAGLTADVVLFTKPAMAHRVTPAVLTLNDQGQIGIKVVGDDNVVKFHAIEIVADTSDGVWVTGLPHTARVISVGQEFVLDGQTVNPVHTGS
ncbi:MAG: efflux RND transporter periplasmic adaptor subunit [Rhodospirillales bacterium]|jgi:membrane fusion protein, multidrug efflux system|nr:efflux RND transporter periplasmic adaptor subunit [Rhodospirillales bacterium]MBT4040284.1 efflux RND transporter periplasmic adaptor subunit [Rhodospirillales bacterium]MBT4626840.1 efflux RND transporter periplasmic adaptor subunit [Rhodospirillales bacterium]MBT5519603.1 efflux RND transporter periplasmic adaptor subunit [Rhodospirillales bacterium]MBT6109958.1 efflux RND transporter periplasmic adaptor subunit [Rhodospirillales bacterium]